MLDVESPDLKAMVGKIKRFPGKQREAQDRVFTSNAYRLMASVIDHASGRPGPRRITGSYVGSIFIRRRRSFTGVVQVSVETNDPRARRLERGFVGKDSEGRTYHQPPYPHWQPAIDETMPVLVTEANEANAEAWRMA